MLMNKWSLWSQWTIVKRSVTAAQAEISHTLYIDLMTVFLHTNIYL